jgi:hypothetical protein
MFKRFTDGYFALGIIFGFAVTIFAIVWVVGLNYCPESPCNYDYKHSHGPTDDPTQHQGWIPRPDLPNYTLQAKPIFTEGNPKEYEYADLQAQENMARATNWIAWFALLSSVVAGAGVWLLISNLNVTRESSRDATRAYVHIKSIHIKDAPDLGEMWADCILFVENSGVTPCKRFEITARAVYDCETVIPLALPASDEQTSGWSALPGNEVFKAPLSIKTSGLEAIENEYSIHIGGTVRYWTFFNEVFETEFSFMIISSFWGGDEVGEDGRSKMDRTQLKIKSYQQVS